MSFNDVPLTLGEARMAARRAADLQKDAEGRRGNAARALAEADSEYRKQKARKIVELHADGVAWTVAESLAVGDEKVALLKYKRDVAKGMLEVYESEAFRLQGDKRILERIVEWSMRRELAEGGTS